MLTNFQNFKEPFTSTAFCLDTLGDTRGPVESDFTNILLMRKRPTYSASRKQHRHDPMKRRPRHRKYNRRVDKIRVEPDRTKDGSCVRSNVILCLEADQDKTQWSTTYWVRDIHTSPIHNDCTRRVRSAQFWHWKLLKTHLDPACEWEHRLSCPSEPSGFRNNFPGKRRPGAECFSRWRRERPVR